MCKWHHNCTEQVVNFILHFIVGILLQISSTTCFYHSLLTPSVYIHAWCVLCLLPMVSLHAYILQSCQICDCYDICSVFNGSLYPTSSLYAHVMGASGLLNLFPRLPLYRPSPNGTCSQNII